MTTRRKPAKAQERRTVSFTVDEGPYEGWSATAFADFKSKWAADLVSGSMDRIIPVLDRIITDHNFPDSDDPLQLAESMGDVDMGALGMVVDEIFGQIAKLPNR